MQIFNPKNTSDSRLSCSPREEIKIVIINPKILSRTFQINNHVLSFPRPLRGPKKLLTNEMTRVDLQIPEHKKFRNLKFK